MDPTLCISHTHGRSTNCCNPNHVKISFSFACRIAERCHIDKLPRTGLPATRSGATQHTNAKPPPAPRVETAIQLSHLLVLGVLDMTFHIETATPN